MHRPKETAQGRSANYGQLADVALGVNRAVNVKGLALGRLSGWVVDTSTTTEKCFCLGSKPSFHPGFHPGFGTGTMKPGQKARTL